MAEWAKDALDWDSDDEALMQEAKAQGCRQLTLVFVIIVAALVCALAVCLLSLASCRADWADYYKRQEEAAAAAACAYCEDELDATDVRVVSVEARGLPEWREFTFRPATRFEVTVETSAGTCQVIVTEALPENREDGDFPRPPDEVTTPVVESADLVS